MGAKDGAERLRTAQPCHMSAPLAVPLSSRIYRHMWQERRRHGDLPLKSKWDLPSWQADRQGASRRKKQEVVVWGGVQRRY